MAEGFKDVGSEAEVATRKDNVLAVAEIKTGIANIRGEMALVKWMLGAAANGHCAVCQPGLRREG